MKVDESLSDAVLELGPEADDVDESDASSPDGADVDALEVASDMLETLEADVPAPPPVWRQVALDLDKDLVFRSVAGHPQAALYAVGVAGAVVEFAALADGAPGPGSDEAPESWRLALSMPELDILNAVWGRADGDAWAVGMQGTLLHREGASWRPFPGEAPEIPAITTTLWDVWGSDSGEYFACGSGGAVFRYDGESWSSMLPETPETFLGLDGRPESGDWIAVGHAGAGLTSAPAAAQDTSVALAGYDWNAAWAGPNGLSIVVGAGGNVLRRSTAGVWTSVGVGAVSELHGVSGLDDGSWWAVGDGGLVVYSDPQGLLSTSTPAGTDTSWRDVHASGPGQVAVVGDDGRVLLADGAGWIAHETPGGKALSAVWSDGAGTILAVGDNGVVMHWDGQSFKAKQKATTLPLHDVYGVAPDRAWAVGPFGILVVWDGTDWSLVDTGTFDDYHAVWARVLPELGEGGANAPDGETIDVVIAGANGQVFRFDGAGLRPLRSIPTVDLRGISGLDEQHIWAVGAQASIFFFDGASWRQQEIAEIVGADGSSSSVTVKLHGVWAASADRVYAVGEQGVVLRLEGEVWQLEVGYEAPDLRAVWVGTEPALRAYAVGLDGTVLAGDALGWRPMDVPSAADLFDVFGYGPDRVYAVGDAATVLRLMRPVQ